MPPPVPAHIDGCLVLGLQAIFWTLFRLRSLFGNQPPGRTHAAPDVARASAARAAPRAEALVAVFGAAVVLCYAGGIAAFFGYFAAWMPWPQRAAGGVILASALGLALWTLLVFRSWRIVAAVDVGHELCTDGPFRVVRHPLYVAFDLVALGSLVWVPSPITLLAFLVMVVSGELRARAEEKLLLAAFGDRYAAYVARTKRFIPGVY